MSKKILALALAFVMLLVTGCQPDSSNEDAGANNNNGGQNSGGSSDGVEEKNESGEFVYKGKITSLDNSRYIEIEIVDSQIAFGVYWVLVSDQTKFIGKDGAETDKDSLKVGDIIEVTFSGQVMMSYPPQISAWEITLI